MHSEPQAQRLSRAVAIANIPVLAMVLVHLTGDLRWLEAPYAPTRNRGLDDNADGGLPRDVQDEVREAAVRALTGWFDGRPPTLADPPHDLLVRMLSVSMGEDVPDEYGPLLAEELALAVAPAPAPSLDTPEGFEVLVVGAGLSGIAMGRRLLEAGVPFTIAEKNPTVGGTWLENAYPGAAVDVPSALYSFSFAPHDWQHVFASRDALLAYLEEISAPIRDRIEFDTTVEKLAWDDASRSWTAETVGDGTRQVRSFSVVVSAVGGLNRPKLPAVDGLDTFSGPVVHTARWPQDLEVDGRRVGVIGNGASAIQVVPAIAGRVAELAVFQRSPQWVAPFKQYLQPVPHDLRWLVGAVPLYRIWARLRAGWTFNDRVHGALQKDPEWPHPERAVSATNDAHRRHFTRYIEEQLQGHPGLIEKATPSYPPFGKRILLDTGWYAALKRPNVELVTASIERVQPGGVLTADGAFHELDVLVCATGFDATRYLAPMEVRGRSGLTLRDAWDDDDARAYLGMTVPDYPNLFILYGPNTQAGHGGSLVGTAEVQIHHILDLLAKMRERGAVVAECRRDVHERFAAEVDRRHERMIWTHPGMNTYYRNSRGRVVVSSPFRVVDYWHRAREASLDDYDLEYADPPGPDDLGSAVAPTAQRGSD
jgi:4-hydroxyacetophenone monooxygenase